MAFRCGNSWIRSRERLAEKRTQEACTAGVQEATSSQQRTLFVGRCPDSITDDDLHDYYKQLGHNTLAKIAWVEKNGQFMGYGFLTFRSDKLASLALSLPPPKVNGTRLVISDYHATKADAKQGGASDGAIKAALQKLKQLDEKRQKVGISEAHRMRSLGKCLDAAQWSEEDLRKDPIRKDFSDVMHQPAMSQQEIEIFYEQNHAECEGSVMVQPVRSFEEVDFGGDAVRQLLAQRFQKPTAIQSLVWPVALRGKDCIGLAETGCGKTLAYLLPSLLHVVKHRRISQDNSVQVRNPAVLILGPTRELVIQIASEASNLPGVSVAVAYGGAGAGGERVTQAVAILKGVDILIGCPGRLIDFLEAQVADLHRVTYFVVDESDQMLNMGFLPQIKSIASQLRSDRQTSMFSATWTKAMWELVKLFMQPADGTVKVVINRADERKKAVSTVKQHFIFCGDVTEKTTKLIRLLKELRSAQDGSSSRSGCRILIFVNSKTHGDALYERLQRHFPAVDILNSEFPQDHRERVMEHFRKDPQGIMVATDVIGRGLDIKNLAYVINYGMPKEFRRYVHRIGRTGRAGESGEAYSFFMEEDASMAHEVIKCLQDAGQAPPPLLFEFAEAWRRARKEKQRARRETKEAALESQSAREIEIDQAEVESVPEEPALEPASRHKKKGKKRTSEEDLAEEDSKEHDRVKQRKKSKASEVSQEEAVEESELLPLDDPSVAGITGALAQHLRGEVSAEATTDIPQWPLLPPWKCKKGKGVKKATKLKPKKASG